RNLTPSPISRLAANRTLRLDRSPHPDPAKRFALALLLARGKENDTLSRHQTAPLSGHVSVVAFA
ncbi:hypothetical protein, partial [Pelagicoccus sp. SDUM812002]|uniref:hypothetical protein n=1 Tax=Pelagicoccus sp. SDUM812002 TaxID=3041266 RepID=UPI00280D7920